ncbi:MAG: hypothetical protein BGO57_09695 [Sphingomonadales bacterium 63-6]|nr:MAG: hypothetical protein BGO57_09695 [Sphingomonadales bacterium 63-6]
MTEPTSRPGAAARRAATPPASSWRRAFLAALAETSNVARAARKAGVPISTVYDTRRKKPDFARQWRDALCEGYDNLEMELLGRLREGEIKRAPGAKMGVRSFDNANAFRLLSVHREGAAQARAERAHLSAAEIRAALERKIAAMRAQVLARQEAETPLIEGPAPKAGAAEANNAE